MDIRLLALWFVCGLASAVFAAAAPPSRAGIAAGVIAFAAGAWWIRQASAPSVAVVAIVAALIAAHHLVRAPRRSYAFASAGLLAGLWSGLLEFQGLPSGLSLPVAASVPAVSAWLVVRRPAFAPSIIREEALLFVVIAGVAAAALPGITDGWHAAASLNLQGRTPDAPAVADTVMPMWTLTLASAALVSGGLFSLWSRR